MCFKRESTLGKAGYSTRGAARSIMATTFSVYIYIYKQKNTVRDPTAAPYSSRIAPF